MNQTLAPLPSLFLNIILATLAIGLPILVVLSIRFLWDRKMHVGRSKELEKLIWQLHRIASAMEQQMNLSFPAVQPGTEDRRDAAYLQPRAAQPDAATRSAAAPSAAPPPATEQAAAQAAATQQPAPEEALPPLERRAPSAEAPRAGVNSMFGL